MELLIGCGSSRERRLVVEGKTGWDRLLTLDNNADHNPDFVHDLNRYPWPFMDNALHEIHAYEVIEHLGQQGDYRSFFEFFAEAYRVLEPGGYFAATCPSYKSMWAFGDPSHTRVITSGTLVFLDQDQYAKQVGVTAMSDFRYLWKGDFKVSWVDMRAEDRGEGLSFILQAVKPSRCDR
jgi:hypothetical protein